MFLKYVYLFMWFQLTYTKIVLNLDTTNNTLLVTHSGINVNVVTAEDINLFKIGTAELKEAARKHYGRKPNAVYVKSPTPWGDLYKTYRWEQISRVISVHSTKVRGITKDIVTVMTQNFINHSNKTIKVDTSLAHTVENTLTTSWSNDTEFTVSQEIEYGIEFVSGTTSFSFTSKWGRSEEKSKSSIIGSTSAVEIELQPGQGVTAILSVNSGFIEVDIVYKITLRGNLAVNFKNRYKGHHFYGPTIESVMNSGGMNEEIFQSETIKFGYHVDASLNVHDTDTGIPLY